MSNPGASKPSNPFLPPQADPADAQPVGRASFHQYRRVCREHETFLKCVGLADLICAGAGVAIVGNAVRLLINMIREETDAPPFVLVQWVLANFVFTPALMGLLVIVGVNLMRRRVSAWRVQILLSGMVAIYFGVHWAMDGLRENTNWQTVAVVGTIAVNVDEPRARHRRHRWGGRTCRAARIRDPDTRSLAEHASRNLDRAIISWVSEE
jgi:hypothetical protein